MRYLIVILLIMFGCDKVCDYAQSGVKAVSHTLSARWQCDEELMYDFLIKPIGKMVCKDSSNEKAMRIDLIGVCPIAVGLLAQLGAGAVAAEFRCNPALVDKDLTNAAVLCSLLKEKK